MPVSGSSEERIGRVEKALQDLIGETSAIRAEQVRLFQWVDEERDARKETNNQLKELIRVGERQIQLQQENTRITTKQELIINRLHAIELQLATTAKDASTASAEVSAGRTRLMTALTNGSVGLLFGAILAYLAMRIRGE